MDIKKILKSKKFKNTAITVLEILIVAGIIFGGLMFIQNKVSNEADKAAGVGQSGRDKASKQKEKGSDNYYIEINKKLRTVIVYQYSKDKKSKMPIKSFKCMIGDKLPNGKFKYSTKYSWIKNNGNWHKNATGIGTNIWIYSTSYKDKYDYRVSLKSYKAINKQKKTSGRCVILNAGDSAWIYNHLKSSTEFVVKKGKKGDKVPNTFEKYIVPDGNCGWDPTDTSSDNPYKKIKSKTVVKGLDTITVEKGHKPDYYGNIIACNGDGKFITNRLKYNDIDYNTAGTYKVKYSYKTKNGTKYNISQKIKVVDTTPPKVRCGQSLYTLEVSSKSLADIVKDDNVKKIENMVKAGVSADEPIVDVQVYTVEKQLLRLDEKVPVVVKAKDTSGNVGSCQVMCQIKYTKSVTVRKKVKVNKDFLKKRKKQAGIEETTKKKKQPTKKVNKKTNKDKETTSVKETTFKKAE